MVGIMIHVLWNYEGDFGHEVLVEASCLGLLERVQEVGHSHL
jgi:hypothetical protein